MFGALVESMLRGCRLLLLSALVLFCLHVPILHAQDLYYVNSPGIDLNVRRGPGTEHEKETQLPHGTPVFVQDRNRSWLKIVAPERGIEGWVLQRYLANQPPGDPLTPGQLGRSQERERFDRLKSQGIIRVRSNKSSGMLTINMNHLIWQRLNRRQQKNFLERASRFYRVGVVELRDRRGIPQSRLQMAGSNAARFESLY